ncbi:hypothetical protein QCA50_014067 [Cerrena zonata]|uniref:Uncharacterized protein n=1 Tax=Cerrena zonata TaxID=2478898 RepID=A0AAW0FUG9_9APHY
MHWQDRELDEGSYRPDSYAESQVDELADRRVNPSRKVSSTGIGKTADLFAHGGALDSQTTDSQWADSFTAEQHATLLQRFNFRDGHWFSSEGERLDVSHAFDAKSPFVTPMTPPDLRVLMELVELEDGGCDWIATQFDGSQLDDASELIEEPKEESPEPHQKASDSEVNKENIAPKDDSHEIGDSNSDARAVDATAVLVDCLDHLVTYQGHSAVLMQEHADMTRRSVAFLGAALERLKLVIACDGTNKQVRVPNDLVTESMPNSDDIEAHGDAGSLAIEDNDLKTETGVSIYNGERVRAVRNGDWVSYLHPDEPSQEILDVEFKPLGSSESIRKRGGVDELVRVNGVSSNMAEMDGNLSDSDDDLPALESMEEGSRLTHVKVYPMLMYGDVCEEVMHMSMKKMYPRAGVTRCHLCSN